MCIIISNPTAEQIPADNLKRALKANPDGCGVAFVKDGRVYVGKSVKSAEINSLIDTYNIAGAVFHFRIKTHGTVKESNCHPFCIFSKDSGDPIDLVMFHNGILDFTDDLRLPNDDRTDSAIFALDYIRPLLAKDYKLLYTDFFKSLLEKVAGNSKLVFLDSNGGRLIINKEKGEEEAGIWYSNRSAFKSRFSYSTSGGYACYYSSNYELFLNYADEVSVTVKRFGSYTSVGYYTLDAQPDKDKAIKKSPLQGNFKNVEYDYKSGKHFLKTEKSLYFYCYLHNAWIDTGCKTPAEFVQALNNKSDILNLEYEKCGY